MTTCYVLSIQVNPGGARESSHWVLNSWEEVCQRLMDSVSSYHGLYLTTWYGRIFTLRLVQDGLIRSECNPKDWLRFERLGPVDHPQFNRSRDDGALTCWREFLVEEDDNTKLKADDFWEQVRHHPEAPVEEGYRVSHPLYAWHFRFPEVPRLQGNADVNTVVPVPGGSVRFPYTSWE